MNAVENRVIVTVSLGADRTWRMTKKPPRGAKAQAKRDRTKIDAPEIHRWTLKNGSLLVMQGNCQQEWYHEIPKEQKVKQGRIVSTGAVGACRPREWLTTRLPE